MAGDRILFLALLLAVMWSQGNAQELCSSVGNCSGCVRTPTCVWCADEDLSNSVTSRCQLGPTISGCNVIENPSGGVTGQIDADPAIDPVTPQSVNVSLRTGVPQSFTINVTALRNLPLDLYLLMDLSTSMLTDLEEVTAASGLIASTIETVTTNVRLGFGSFNEKVTRPYTFFDPPPAEEPMQCRNEGFECPPYAFRHQISLTNNIEEFVARISLLDVTINVDEPENGLEAMAQVITCEEIIGWRSRDGVGPDRGLLRIILYISDDHFHYAGEGQLAGIIEPYVGTCLLNRTGPDPVDFTAWDTIDYPSVGQIALLVQQFEVVPIFASSESFQSTYETLAELINRKYRAVSAVLAENSANITTLIRDEVTAILQTISLEPSISPILDISASVAATCPDLAIEVDNSCQNVQLDSTASFEVTVTLNSCFNQATGELLEGPIDYPVNIPTFGDFTVRVTPLCDCGCEANSEFNSSMCSFNGNFTCGVCECFPGFCGVNCSISIGSILNCPRGGINNDICSGRGTCECTCQCDTEIDDEPRAQLVTNPIIFGMACECDNFRCDIDDDGNVCGGLTRGICCNNTCMCLNSQSGQPFTGTNCECLPVDQACVDPQNSDVVCNGRGTCGCNQCVCDLLWTGQFCEVPRDTTSCPTDEERCIVCSKDLLPAENCTGCPTAAFPIAGVPRRDFDRAVPESLDDVATMTAIAELTTTRVNNGIFRFVTECTFADFEDCEHEYYVLRNDTSFLILSINGRSCPASDLLSIPVWALAPIILGALLILGLLILFIIKLLFLILDYQEVKRWQKEAREADFSKNQNPLYLSPESKFENVAYGRPM